MTDKVQTSLAYCRGAIQQSLSQSSVNHLKFLISQSTKIIVSILLPKGPLLKTVHRSEFCGPTLSFPNSQGILASFMEQFLTLFQFQQNLSLNTQPISLMEDECDSVCLGGWGRQSAECEGPLLDIIPSIKDTLYASVSQSIKLGSNNTYFKELL